MFNKKVSNVLTSFVFFFSISLNLPCQAATNEMVLIPGGKIKSEKDAKALKAFYIQKTEVTWAEYKNVVKDANFEGGMEKHPATEVSYFDAEAYCKAIGGRLPTMEEWIMAARGPDGRAYPWGNEFQASAANTSESGKNGTVPVGSFENGKSPYGLYDMAGNVWEWVNSWDEAKHYRFLMGGSYFENSSKCTTTSKLSSIPDDMHLYSGFRCAKDK
jgi:formylglycine-generating enzyme required for sulfatase activity